jgi:hypothetical protein
LDLQDEILGQFRVLIEYDRPLPPSGAEAAPRSAPIPVLETGRTQQRYVTLENASRDEVVVVRQNQLQPLGRQQSEWKSLASILGDGITTAFLVAGDAEDPALAYTMKQRKTVQTAGAAIGLSETMLVVDRSGGYRGQQVYHVTNTTEQYLVIELPAGAELWTATVSGDPVKPTPVKLSPGNPPPGTGVAGGQIRIPLIKTAEGDSDYPVVLKYGGGLGRALQNLRKVRFPLIRSQNIEAEISRVRLWLPEDYEWFDFGGSMRRVRDEGEYEADYFTYNLSQMKRLMQAWNSDNPYAKVRVANNMKNIGLALQNYQEMYREYMDNSTFNSNFNLNSGFVAQAQQETERYFAEEEAVVVEDNRRRLNSFWMEQRNGLANNVVNDLGGNFDAGPVSGPESSSSGRFNYEWFARNQLDAKTPQQPEQQQLRFSQGGRQQDAGEKLKAFARDNSLLQQRGKEAKPTDDLNADAYNRPETSGKGSLALRQSQRTLTREYRERLGKALDGQQQAGGPAQPGQAAASGGALDDGASFEGLADADTLQPLPSVTRNGRGPSVSGVAMAGDMGTRLSTSSADGSLRLWESTATAPAYLASLDVQLPARGTEFLFTTPRGEIEITGRAVSSDLLDRTKRIAALLTGLAGVWLAWRIVRWLLRTLSESTWAAAGLLLCGLFSLLIGVLPLAGLLAVVCGLIQLVRLGIQRRPNREAVPSRDLA